MVGPAADGMTHPPTELREGTEAGAALHSPCRHLAGSCGWAGGLLQREQQEFVLL